MKNLGVQGTNTIEDERQLRNGLEKWRLVRLCAIEDEMDELNQDYRAAQDGLGIAHRNPGEIDEDVIQYLWQELNRSVTELERLEKQHQELMEMDLPRLIVTFQRRNKIKTWPWEQEKWDLATF